MEPSENFVVELLAAQLAVAEYAAEHDELLAGEHTFWLHERDMNSRICKEEVREQLEIFLEPENPDGAVQLMEAAGMSKETIDIYCQSIRDRLSGRVRTLAPARKRKYTGVYQNGNRWYARVQSKALDVRWEHRCDTEEEAMLAREQKIDEMGWTWAKRNSQ